MRAGIQQTEAVSGRAWASLREGNRRAGKAGGSGPGVPPAVPAKKATHSGHSVDAEGSAEGSCSTARGLGHAAQNHTHSNLLEILSNADTTPRSGQGPRFCTCHELPGGARAAGARTTQAATLQELCQDSGCSPANSTGRREEKTAPVSFMVNSQPSTPTKGVP